MRNRRKEIGAIIHVGITVKDMERAKQFYGEVLNLYYKGEMVMEGESTNALFGIPSCKVTVAYFNGSNRIGSPPIELLYFHNQLIEDNRSSLLRASLSEVCFSVKNIQDTYKRMCERGVVFLSEPQYFDLSDQGFGRSWAVYFKDSEGNILELIEEMCNE